MLKLWNYILYPHDVLAIWIDEIVDVMISKEDQQKLKHFEKTVFFKKFYIHFYFLTLCVFVSIHNIGRSVPLGHWPASLLKMSLFHRCFSNILLVKTNYLVSTSVEHWSKMGKEQIREDNQFLKNYTASNWV